VALVVLVPPVAALPPVPPPPQAAKEARSGAARISEAKRGRLFIARA
jgi:hypothetical protein